MDAVAQNVHYLVPDENSPCDIFLHFRGQYVLALGENQKVTFSILEKLSKVRCLFIYVRTEDLPKWSLWTAKRHPLLDNPKESSASDEDTGKLYGNKRAELLSFMQKSLVPKAADNISLNKAIENARNLVQRAVRVAYLDWYFQQFHEPPDLFHHTGRVTFGTAIFCSMYPLLTSKELETLVVSSLIHELSGDPTTSLTTVVSQQTLAALEKAKQPVPKDVIELIRVQDELASGKGFPNNKALNDIPVGVRAFTLFNHFDHYRLKASGTRRTKFERTKQQMTARKQDYDPALWDKFWLFMENDIEVMA